MLKLNGGLEQREREIAVLKTPSTQSWDRATAGGAGGNGQNEIKATRFGGAVFSQRKTHTWILKAVSLLLWGRPEGKAGQCGA